MRVDLINSQLWEDFNEQLAVRAQATVGQSREVQSRAYPGLAAAVTELALGTSLFFSHKKSIAVIQGETWAFEGLLPHLYKQGLQVIEVQSHQINDWKEWVEALPKDTNFVLWSEDHPVNGAFEDREALDEALSARRIFSIRVSHSAHRFKRPPIRPYTVRICSFEENIVIAQCGTRFRTPPLFVHRAPWGKEMLDAFLAALSSASLEHEEVVKNFEGHPELAGGGFQPFPFSGKARIWDRAVIYHPSINSEAVLSEILGADQPLLPGLERRAEAINACRWNFLPEIRTWWNPLPAETVLRGLLVLDAELLGPSEFLKKLIDVSKKARI